MKKSYKKNKLAELNNDELISVAPAKNELEIVSMETHVSEDGKDLITNSVIIPPVPLERVNLNIEVTPKGIIEVVEKEEGSIFEKEAEEPSVFEQSVEEKVIEEKKVEKPQQYYKITFVQEKKQKQYFTKNIPELRGTILTLKNAFEKITFEENVLGKKLVTASCKLELDAIVRLDLNKGVLVIMSPIENWMSADKTNIEKIYNERVLNAYRELASSVIPTVVKPKEKTSGLINL